MGSCASTTVNSSTKELTNQISAVPGRDIKHALCERHSNTVTHFNVKTEELYCLSCYQDYKRRHTRSESAQVYEITEYVTTIQFKQSEIQTLEKLRNNRYSTEHSLLQISQTRNKLESKRTQILDEIKLFVNTVIELIRHLEEEICRDTNQKILGAITELKDYQVKLQTELKTLTTFKTDIESNRKTGNNAARLKTVYSCKNFLKKNATGRNEVNDYNTALKLNKYISLNEILGKERYTQKVSLGYVTCERKKSDASYDALSDISEDVSEESVYTNRSTTQQTNSTSGANSTQRYTDERTVTRTPVVGTSLQRSTQYAEVKVKQSPDLDVDKGSPEQTKEKGTVIVNNELQELVGDQVEAIDRPSTKVINLNQMEETFDKSHQRLKFLRENVIARNVPRRDSGTSSRKTPTPRRSTQSIVSPGNITSPYFISPRPTQHKKSMEKRIAVKFREVKLTRDENISNVTHTTQLGDGNIVLCDQKNEKLLLMDKQFEVISEVKLSGHPHNVTNVPDDTGRIAVTVPDENTIKIVAVVDDIFDEKIEVIKLQSKPKCRGIDYVDGNLIYTTRNDVAVLRKGDMTRTWKFKYAFRDPVSLSADRRNDVIYVSCLGLKSFGEVVKMHFNDEKIDFVISCSEIQHPVCSTIDRDGYIYICDIDPPSIHQVSPDGKYCRRLLTASNGKFQHVSFIEGTDMFIATENDSDTVHIYEMA